MNDTLTRMQELIGYKSITPKGNIVEDTVLASNGKTYAIIKEGLDYYIKCSNKKGKDLVKEDFDYIGGFMERKSNCFNSYAKASQQLNLKLMAIDEATGKRTEKLNEHKTPAEWQLEAAKEIREEMNRFSRVDEAISKIQEEKEPVRYDNVKGSGKKFVTPFEEKGDKRITKGDNETYSKSVKPKLDFKSNKEDFEEDDVYTERVQGRKPKSTLKPFKPVMKESTHIDEENIYEICIEHGDKNECDGKGCSSKKPRILKKNKFPKGRF